MGGSVAAGASGRSRKDGFWITAIGLVLLAAVTGIAVIVTAKGPSSDNPFAGETLYASPQSSAATAAKLANGTADSAPLSALARVPAAVWLLPEEHPTGEVTEFVTRLEADAAFRSQLPVLVVYGIPTRDCGNFSAGGTEAADYPGWVSAIARGIASSKTVVILEPDALALAPSCGTEEATTSLLKKAVTVLSDNPRTTVYLDGGHSHWLPAEEMAPLLTAAGVEQVRGFATNVSNYNTTDDERAYGEKLSKLLGGAHFVVDTSRNGSGSTGEWCNPPGRTVGLTPSGVDDGTAQDANLWVKNPGESDGECNGGPPAGQWWPSRAREFARSIS
ncbi:glycoside hydrolase family 6 protein [soil metagenome]